MKYVRLGDLLVKSGTITQTQLDEALKLDALHQMNADIETAKIEEAKADADRRR